jgi:hypothetical protein
MDQPVAPLSMSGPAALTDRATTVSTADNRSISVIICSIDGSKSSRIRTHYEALLSGYKHELIVIGDARSLCEG